MRKKNNIMVAYYAKSKPLESFSEKELNLIADELENKSVFIGEDVKKYLKKLSNKYNGVLIGLDKMYKSRERILQKLKRNKYPRDVLRFTILFSENNYLCSSLGLFNDIIKYKSVQFDPINIKQRWDLGDYYQGINTSFTWENIPWELQIHTIRSLKSKSGKTHKIYETYQKHKCDKRKTKKCKKLKQELLNIEKRVPLPKGMRKQLTRKLICKKNKSCKKLKCI